MRTLAGFDVPVLRMRVRLLFEPRDLWVGLFWNARTEKHLEFYLCAVPCFPVRLELGSGYSECQCCRVVEHVSTCMYVEASPQYHSYVPDLPRWLLRRMLCEVCRNPETWRELDRKLHLRPHRRHVAAPRSR